MTKKRRAAWYKLFSIVMVLSMLAGLVVPVTPAVAYAEGEEAFLELQDLTTDVDDPLLDSPGSPLESVPEDDAEQMAEEDTVYDEEDPDESASEDDAQEDTVADAVSDEETSEENTSEDDAEEDTVTNTVYGEATLERTSMGVGILSDSESITVKVFGDGVENEVIFSWEELEAMRGTESWVGPRVYSTINTWPTKKWYAAEGVKLSALLEAAQIKNEAQQIIVRATDSYAMTFTKKELLEDTRYYFPNLKENHEYWGQVPGSPEDAEPVDAIIALKSVENNDNFAYMTPLNCPLFVLGQRAVTEQTNHTFVKNVGEIEVLIDPPSKWTAPVANPAGGEVPVGKEVVLTNEFNDSDKIYYTTDGSDPTLDSPIYNWIASRWWGTRWDVLDEINKPIVITEDTIIKAKTIGFGREDSDIATFEYTVPKVSVTGVSISEGNQELEVGETVQLTAVVEPEDATDKSVTWSSSNEAVATVDESGLVTAVAAGEATITVTTTDGGFTDSINITVVSAVPDVFVVEDGVLVGYNGEGGNVVIPSNLGITVIGDRVFSKNSGLTSVIIPEGVTVIEEYAFYHCSNLKTVIFPESLTLMGPYAFSGCSSLTSLTIPENVTEIGTNAFRNCSSLIELNLPDNLEVIGSNVFRNCSSLTSLTIPAKLTTISGSAFADCTSLAEVTIMEGVVNIYGTAFSDCSSLNKIIIPSSVESIAKSAFKNCEQLTIHGYRGSYAETFANENSIPFVALDGENIPLTIVVKEDGTEIRTVSYNMADWETTRQRYSARDSMPAYRLGAAEGVFLEDLLGNVEIDVSKVTGFKFISTDGQVMPVSKSELLDVPRYYYPNIFGADQEEGAELVKPMLALKSYVGARGNSEPPSWDMMDDLNTIRLFVGQKDPLDINYGLFAKWICEFEVELETTGVPVTGVSITEGDQELEVGETVQLTAVVQPEDAADKSVTWSSDNEAVATVDETGLVTAVSVGTVTITVTTNDGGFTDSIEVTVVSAPSDFEVEDGVLKKYKGAGGAVVIPGNLGITSIGSSAFAYKENVTSVRIPDGVTSIGGNAFYGCSNLASVSLPDGLTVIDYNAFKGCSSLTSISIPDSVTKFGSSAFAECRSLTSINIPEGITTIENYLFDGCSSLTGLAIPDSVTSIGSFAFQNCSRLAELAIPDNITSIGGYAFYNCSSLTEMTIPAGVNSIGQYAFAKCSGLTAVTVLNSIASIGNNAFADCPGLTIIGYAGSTANRYAAKNGIPFVAIEPTVRVTGVRINEGDQELAVRRTLQLSYEIEPENASNKAVTWSSSNENIASVSETGLVTAKSEGEATITVTSVDGNFTDSITVTVVPPPEFVVENGRLIEYNGAGGDVIIPGDLGITSIGRAFRNSSTLTSITIPEGVTQIVSNAFDGCSNLTQVSLPAGIETIANYTFNNCSSLLEITLPEGVTSIGQYAFANCSSLAAITLPHSLTTISSYAFRNCNSLTEVVFPEGVTMIGTAAFQNCSNLASATFLNSNATIDSWAFNGCNLSTIYGYSGSTAETYANKNGIPFVALDAKPHIVSIIPVDDVQVPCGTLEADAIAALASETTITDSDGATHTVALEWTITNYDGNTPGAYTATGTFELPEGVVQSDPPMELKVTAAVTVLAQAKYAVTLTVEPAGGGTVTGAGEYAEGDSVTVEAQAAEGYAFVNWTDAEGEVSTEASYTFTMPAEAVSLTANFRPLEHSQYAFDYKVPAEIVEGQDVEVAVTFASVEVKDLGYNSVRFKFSADGPGNVTFTAPDSEGVEHTFTNEGYWGPVGGFDLPAQYSATTDWTLNFAEAGDYTVTFSLIDAASEDVIAGITDSVTVSVLEEQPLYIVSITPVDDVQVPCGTLEADAIAALASETTITDSDGETHTVALEWTITDYDGNTPGAYTATGTFELPAGVEQSDPPMELKVSATVTVVAQAYNMLSVEAEPADIPIGESFTVAVNIENIRDVQGYEVTLKYDPAYAEYKTHRVNFKPVTIDLETIKDGEITVANFVLGDAPWEQDSGALVEVEFESRYPGTIEGGVYDFTFEEIEVVLEPRDSSDPAVREKLDSPVVKYYEGSDVDIYAALELREDHGGITSTLQNGSAYEATTGSDGSATIEMVRSGEYSLTLEAGGYLKAVVEGVVVTFGEENQVGTADVPVKLYVGDVNGDGKINIIDISLAANKFGQTGAPGWVIEDLNLDGKVDISDLTAIARNYDMTTADTTYNYKDEAPYWE